LGNTPFQFNKLSIAFGENRFIPSSVLSNLRRRVINDLLDERKANHFRPDRQMPPDSPMYPTTHLTYLGNVANQKAQTFYQQSGVRTIEPAFETETKTNIPVMFSKHCILHQLGYCKKEKKVENNWVYPLYLLSGTHRLKLEFDCRHCEMTVIV
jgi:putative protease